MLKGIVKLFLAYHGGLKDGVGEGLLESVV